MFLAFLLTSAHTERHLNLDILYRTFICVCEIGLMASILSIDSGITISLCNGVCMDVV